MHDHTDNSSLGNPGISGFGGIIRNAHGGWLTSYYGNYDHTTIMHACEAPCDLSGTAYCVGS